ncbi:hypothetical protein XA68_17027 [Ophiocordyceps unilateralis]|uniref:Hydantoinase/oxoprolinase N-terminal domain-containing protein n=1 Tax=Ophiocordyceps unilateralis TaxID=268505 RepID=A0A2A9P5K6_OPHUN|nr:hypothetical protein XA68_17027 [Ophiocordyceps unilateralis]
MSSYRIGVDVGGTNTDAAILDISALDQPGRGVLASHKTLTTADITSGIEAAIRAVLADSGVDQDHVLSVTIGTTHFINALVEADARRLDRVAVIRLCGPFTRQLPPFSGFPVGLRRIIEGGLHYIDGGLEMNGREIAPLDPHQIRRVAAEIVAAGISAVALVGVFSPLDHDGIHEERCRELLLREAPGLRVVCSRSIGSTGLLERENATILNAAILRTARHVKRGFRRAMGRLRLRCPLFLSQNDGTLIDADVAAELPIKTFASGPTNSMTGAAFLAGIDRAAPAADAEGPQVLVVDIGGTTTDICALLPSGFPRQAPGFVDVGGVRTAFSMPEVLSVGLGGGSKVVVTPDPHRPGFDLVSVGPASVGHRLREEARVFGGSTLTATDAIAAAGGNDLGDAALVADVPRTTIDLACQDIRHKLETIIDRMRVSAAPVHVLLVGGGAILVREELAGVDKCIRPVHQGAANAVGAAIAKVSGEVDSLEILGRRQEREIIDAACSRAVDLAVEKGASRDDVRVVEINKTPLQYMSQETIRIQVRAVGKLAIPVGPAPSRSSAGDAEPPVTGEADDDRDEDDDDDNDDAPKVSIPDALEPTTKPTLGVDLATYRPDVRAGVWYVSEIDLELIATGCGVLGTGGGGPTYYEYLKCLNSRRGPGGDKMRIISAQSLADDDVVCFGAWYGSPSVINERIPGGNEIAAAIDAVNLIKGNDSFAALCLDEIGGGNGMCALPNCVRYDCPVIDGDAMGRAYPTLYHTSFCVYGYSMTPCTVTDAAGNVVVATKTDNPFRLETLIRTASVEMGLSCASSPNPLPASAVKAHGVPNTISQAWYLGRAVHMARRSKANYVDAIFSVCDGKLLFTGKITDVHRYIGGGYTMGAVLLAPLSDEERESPANASRQQVPTDKHMIIPFQNEYLYAAHCDALGSEPSREVVCTVPSLISILGQDGEAIGSQDLRYGLRVNVIALPAHPLWRTPEALKVGGPEGFGLNMPEVGVETCEEFKGARSVIDEFRE